AFLRAPRARRMAAAAGLSFPTTHGVVDGVHGHAADARALPAPAVAASLTPGYQLVLGVPDLAHGGPTVCVDHADLARGEPKRRPLAFLGQQLDPSAGGAAHLGAPAGLQLDGVDDGADRDVRERECIPRPDVRAGPGLNRRALLEALRRQDV